MGSVQNISVSEQKLDGIDVDFEEFPESTKCAENIENEVNPDNIIGRVISRKRMRCRVLKSYFAKILWNKRELKITFYD